ncbi:DUF4062 domain-containing protein [Microbulbifer sp. S227A]|uniref:DUF4062 domain-containing protein n=1 Tax=Microbulbifer sp. S227A TaxID=3415131 RepID=UPI003C7E4B4A
MDSHRVTIPNPEGKGTIFLSSNFLEDEGILDARYPLREAILDFAPSLSAPLVTWEALKERFQKDEDILTLCRQAIETCSLFVLLLGKRHGSGVRLDQGTSSASYLEMEIFTAAILKKPILVLHEAGVEPNALLRDLLTLFKDRFSSVAYRSGSVVDLCKSLAEAAKVLGEAGDLRRAGSLRGVPDFLAATRLQNDLVREMRDPRLRFLNGSSVPQTPGASAIEIERTLAAIDARSTADGEGLVPVTQGAMLFRVWAAMRDLAASDNFIASKPERPEAWDTLLTHWQKAASWFGLHGCIYLSPLAVINTRQALWEQNSEKFGNLEELTTSRASAYYSLAQRMHTRAQTRRGFQQSRALATRAYDQLGNAAVGSLMIRCHANIRLAGLGSPLLISDALADARKALEIYDMGVGDLTGRGEALVSLGFCKAITGRLRTGKADMRHGLHLLSQNPTPNGRSFYAKGGKMVARAGRLLLDTRLRIDGEEAQIAAATAVGAFDQLRRG